MTYRGLILDDTCANLVYICPKTSTTMSDMSDRFDNTTGKDLPSSDRYPIDKIKAFIRAKISNDGQDLRNRAIEMIHFVETDEEMVPVFEALLRSDQLDLQLDGIRALGALKCAIGATLLIDFYEHKEESDAVTDAILVALGEIGGVESLNFLEHFLDSHFGRREEIDEHGMLAVESLTVLAVRGVEKARDIIIRMCDSPAWNLRESCAFAFGVIFGNRSAIPPQIYELLTLLTKDENINVRIAAYSSLDDIVGLDQAGRVKLQEAREKQVFG